jgi:outer membrane protein OmpA-like peptidoglycan-associated protein
LSLSRALAVRAFLIEQGVRSTRMDVRALGDKVPDGPVDRVDVLPQAANQ